MSAKIRHPYPFSTERNMELGTFSVSLAMNDEATTGPASFVALDPDGNPILVDQHV